MNEKIEKWKKIKCSECGHEYLKQISGKNLTETESEQYNDGKMYIKRNQHLYGDWRKFSDQELINIGKTLYQGMVKK